MAIFKMYGYIYGYKYVICGHIYIYIWQSDEEIKKFKFT